VPHLAAERQDDVIITRGASGAAARAIQRRCSAGELARLAPGIYVREHDPQAQAARVREQWVRIVSELAPGSVVSYRSALAQDPAGEGVLILSHPTRFNRSIRLPGLRMALVKGPGPLPGDTPLAGGALHRASIERALLENLTRPRGAEGRSRGETAVMERLTRMSRDAGVEALVAMRARARELAPSLNMAAELRRVEGLIDTLRPSRPQTEAKARPLRAGGEAGPDAACVAMLRALAERLRSRRLPRLGAPPAQEPARAHQAFLEAWFDLSQSDRVLSIQRAREAVLGGRLDTVDEVGLRELVGVFRLAAHSPLCDSVPPFGAWFAQGLKARQALMMQLGRADAASGFRTEGAQPAAAGFVEADRIHGTLRAGSLLARGIPDGLARAIFYSILIWRVHPFDRGSESMASLLMNAELSSVSESRILVAPRMRARLEQSRQALLRTGDPSRLIRLLAALQRWTASLDFSDLDRLLARLDRARALG